MNSIVSPAHHRSVRAKRLYIIVTKLWYEYTDHAEQLGRGHRATKLAFSNYKLFRSILDRN